MDDPNAPNLTCYTTLVPLSLKRFKDIPRKSPDPKDKDEPKTFAGQGSYGQVMIMEDQDTNRQVAVKFFKKHRDDYSALPWFGLREFVNLHVLQSHPNLVKLVGSNFIIDEPFIVMEKASVDLAHAMGHSLWPRLEKNILSYMHQLLSGVKYMHDNLIWHLDLKPANLLLFGGQAEHLKITDLGLSLSGPFAWRDKPLSVISLFWRPPELLMKRILRHRWQYEPSFGINWPYGETADSYSVGVIYMGMLQASTQQKLLITRRDIEERLDDRSASLDEDERKKLLNQLKEVNDILDFWSIDKEEVHTRDVFSILDIGESDTAMDWSTLHFKTRENAYKMLSQSIVTRIEKDKLNDLREYYEHNIDRTEKGKQEIQNVAKEYDNLIKKTKQEWMDMAESNENTTREEDNQFVRTQFENLTKHDFTDQEWTLLSSLLCCDPRRRITVTEALALPLFKNFDRVLTVIPIQGEKRKSRFYPSLSSWKTSLQYMYYWIGQSKQSSEIFFMATRFLLCVVSKYVAQREKEVTRDQLKEIYFLSAAASLELCSLYSGGDSMQDVILKTISGLSVKEFHKLVRHNLYFVNGRVQQMNAYYYLETLLTNPNIVDPNTQYPLQDYLQIMALIQMSPLFFQLQDKEIAMLTVYILNDVKVKDVNEDKELDFEDLKEKVSTFAKENEDISIIQGLEKYLFETKLE